VQLGTARDDETVPFGAVPRHEVGSIEWPTRLLVESLPPLASKLSLRALAARVLVAARTRTSSLVLFIALGSSPLWLGFFASLLVSACVL
jgi:hypothetical protein